MARALRGGSGSIEWQGILDCETQDVSLKVFYDSILTGHVSLVTFALINVVF